MQRPVPLSDLAKRALAILLLQPELGLQVEQSLVENIADDPGSTLLGEVLRLIVDEDTLSPVMILSRFQASENFDLLKGLAEKESLLAPQDIAPEFFSILQMISESKLQESAESMKRRLEANFSSLTPEEKDQLRTISLQLGKTNRK